MLMAGSWWVTRPPRCRNPAPARAISSVAAPRFTLPKPPPQRSRIFSPGAVAIAIALLAGALALRREAVAAEGLGGIIDVHEHIVLPPARTKSLIDVMDRRGIATMFLLDSPDVTFDSDAEFEGYDETVTRQLAMKRLDPQRFRVFYTYPA